MGEKLLARRILMLLRETSGRSGRTAQVVLGWAADQSGWLWPDTVFAAPGSDEAGETLAWERLDALAAAIADDDGEPELFESLDAISDLLEFDPFDRELLRIAAALARLPRLAALRARLPAAGADLLSLIGRLAGADPASAVGRVRRSGPVCLGLLLIVSDGSYGLDVELPWRFGRLLDGGLLDEDRILDALAGLRQRAALDAEDFAEQAGPLDLMVRLLRGALDRKAAGVNLLVYGPPGTGKTEFARTLAAAAGASLFAVGECDEDGDEPSRYERLHALKRAERMLARRGDAILLFDEMEDLFAEAELDAAGGRRAGSKIFVNRLLEQNRVPTIWTSNSLDVDPAHLRRLTYILRMDYPGPRARARIVARVAAGEDAIEAARGLDPLLPKECEATAIARVALRGAALAGGGSTEAGAIAASLLAGLRGGRALPPAPAGGTLALDLYDPEIARLVDRISAPDAPGDFSLLLTGSPGTGKTALACHLAERLDRPLSVKRTSDLLSKWVGGTEANIAEAFARARDEGSVLLFDEADSLLHDRADAQRSWEVSQVNELLTWMDSHPLPFIAATNFARRLDPAALRRFVFKLELAPLSGEGAARAFERFFGCAAPAALASVRGLTPGDFAVVRRQLRYRGEARPEEIVDLLEAEARAKPEAMGRIGF